jgi:predicted permease
MDIVVLLEKIGNIFLLILIGYVFGKIARTSEEFTSTLSKIVLNIAVPASILSSLNGVDFESIRSDMLTLILICACVVIATFVLCLVFGRILEPASKLNRSVFTGVVLLNNFGFMGFPVCEVLLGSKGMLYAVLYSMPMNLFLFSLGPYILSRAGGHGKLFDKSMLTNAPLISTIFALIVLITRLQFPEFVSSLISTVGSLQTPLAMMVIGMILAAANIKAMLKGFKVYGYSIVRLLLLPLLTFAALKLLGFSGLMLGVPVIIAAMPAGALSVVYVQRSGLDAMYASQLLIVSTLFSIITIPLVSLLII